VRIGEDYESLAWGEGELIGKEVYFNSVALTHNHFPVDVKKV
jgi:hypothetical protein